MILSKGSLKALNNKILSLLGFAAKAGKLSYGFEATLWSVKTAKARLLAVAEDISPKSRKEMHYYADKYNVKITVLEGIDIKTVSDAVGKKCGIVAVLDRGFADAILKAAEIQANEDIKGGNADDK